MRRMSDPVEGRHPLDNYPAPPPRGVDLPYSDGEPMESRRHFQQMVLLIETLNRAWRDRDDFFVGGDMFVYFSETQAKNNDFRGPDVFVVLDSHRDDDRRSWVVWEENGRTPDVVIELLSPSTEAVDRGRKMDIYARVLKVAAYYLYDPLTHVLEGYALDETSRRYRPLAEAADGTLPCEPLGLRLGIVEGVHFLGDHRPWLRWLDASGPLPTDAEVIEDAEKRAEAERQRAEAERRRADEQQRRADELAARLAELERGR